MATHTASQAAHPFSILGDTLESAAESFEDAAANAPESARRAAAATRRALGTGFFNACYGLSFGVVYSAVFVAELLPADGTVRRAFTEGAEAAQEARRQARAGAKSRNGVKPKTSAGHVGSKTSSTARTAHKNGVGSSRATKPRVRRPTSAGSK